MKPTYSFVINFKRFDRTNPTLQDVQKVSVSGICVISKREKFGGVTISKYVKDIKGKFSYSAGSQNYPILYPVKDTKIYIHNFPRLPKLDFDDLDIKHKSDFLYLSDVNEEITL